MVDYIARILCEKLQQGCWLSLLDENLEEIGDRLPFYEWCLDGNSVFNNSIINFQLPQVDARIEAIGFYANEFDHKRYLNVWVDNPVELDCDCSYIMFRPGDLKIIVS